jgi:hypothetical protein
MTKTAAKIHLLIIGLYLVLSLALTCPLPLHFTTHVPGSATWAFDEYTFLWNMWWFKYSVFDLQTNPLYSSFIFYPLGISLVLYTYHLHNALLSMPWQPFLSLATINNILLVGSLALSGYGTFLLLDYLLISEKDTSRIPSPLPRRRCPELVEGRCPELVGAARQCRGMAAFLGGIVYAFTASRFVYLALGHYNFASNHWIPFYALYVIKTIREPRAKNALWAGIFLTLTLSCEMTYGIFLAVFTIVYLLFTSKKILNIQSAKRLGLLAITFLLTYSPMLYFVFREMLYGGYTLEGWGDALKLSTDLLGFFTPTKLHPLWGGNWVRELRAVVEGTARFSDVNTVFVGYMTLLLAIFALFKYRQALKVWGVAALTSAILSLGPLLQINGQYLFDLDGLLVEAKITFPMPFALLHYLPIANANRAPNRFSVIMTLSLAVMVGHAAFWILNRVSSTSPSARCVLRIACGMLLLTTLSFEHLSIPLPLTDARIPEVCYQIGAEPGHFAVLQLPMGWRNSFGTLGSERTQAQYYQAAHHKPIIGGNISRNPPFKFEYFRRISLFKSITALELYEEVDAPTRERDKVLAPELMYLYDVRYLLILPPIPGRLPYADTMTRTVDYALEVLPLEPEPVYNRHGVLAYRVIQPPPRTDFIIDFGLEETEMYRGEGWSWNEEIGSVSANWAMAQRARVFIPLHKMGDYRLTIAALPFSYQGTPPQRVNIMMNGYPVSELSLTANWAPYEVDIPSTVIRYGLNEITLHFSHLASPQDVLPGSSDQRTLAVAVDYVKLEQVNASSEGSHSE